MTLTLREVDDCGSVEALLHDIAALGEDVLATFGCEGLVNVLGEVEDVDDVADQKSGGR